MEFNAMQRNVIQLYATHPAAIAGRVRRRRLQVVRSADAVEDLQQLQRLDAVVRAVRHLCRAPLMQCNATQFISQEHDATQRNAIERRERTMRWKSANWRPNFAKIMRSHDSMLTAVCDLVVVGSAIDTALLCP